MSLLLAVSFLGCLSSPTGPPDDPALPIPEEPILEDPGSGGGGEDPGVIPSEADPPGFVDPFHAKLKRGGFWDGFWTGSTSKLTEDREANGVNSERNASIRWLGGIGGYDDPQRYLDQGRIRFRVKINADGLETGGGGKHLVNLASNALSRGRRDEARVTRIEIANPGDDPPRFVLHNYVGGRGGATEMGKLPFTFEPDRWVDIDWSWRLDGRELTIECNGRRYHATLLEGSEGPGRYFGPGHMETPSGGGKFTFADFRVSGR